MLENASKHHLGSNGVEWCIWCEIIFATSAPRNSAFTLETQVLHLLHSERFWNTPKHSQTSFWVQWSKMNAVGMKPFLQLEYSKIVHSVLKHMFASFHMWKVYEMLQSTPENHFGSNEVEWLHLARNHFRNLSTPRNSVFSHEIQVLHLFTRGRFTKCSKILPNII
jgi:hypothetical protein